MSTDTLTRTRPRPVDAPPIDPRLRARRIEVARGRGRRRLRRLGVLAVLAVLGGVAYGASQSALLDVDHVVVEGEVGERAESVAAAIDVARGAPMVHVDPGSARRRVEGLPWVHTAEVRRDWPGTVTVAVTAREPVAAHTSGMGIDAEGRVIGPVAPTSLPSVGFPVGEAGTTVAAEYHELLTVLAALPPDLASEVRTGTVVSGEVRLTLTDGIRVRFGTAQRRSAKFVAVRALLDQAGRSTISHLDVRVPSSPSLTRRPGTGA